MEQDRFAEAALAYQRLAGKLEEPQSVQWDQMTAASAARDWTMLREVAAGMGMGSPPATDRSRKTGAG